MVNAQGLNSCKQILELYGRQTTPTGPDSIYDFNQDQKVNLLDCVSSLFPSPTPVPGTPTPTPDPGTLQAEIEDLNTQLLQLASLGTTDLAVAEQRKEKLLALIPQNPGLAYELMFTAGELDNYRSTLGENLEDEIDATGTLNVAIADDFVNGTSETFYELVLDSGQSQLFNESLALRNDQSSTLQGKLNFVDPADAVNVDGAVLGASESLVHENIKSLKQNSNAAMQQFGNGNYSWRTYLAQNLNSEIVKVLGAKTIDPKVLDRPSDDTFDDESDKARGNLLVQSASRDLHKVDRENSGTVLASTTPSSYRIYSAQPMPSVLSGSTVQVQGMALDNLITIGFQSIQGQTTVLQSSIPNAIGSKKLLAMMVNFEHDKDNKPISSLELTEFVLKATDTFQELSYQQFEIQNSLILDWKSISLNSKPDDQCDIYQIATSAVIKNDSEINILDYDNGIIVVFMPPLAQCKFAGSAFIGFKDFQTVKGIINAGVSVVILQSWNNGFNWLPNIITHEIGHTLGASHANAWNCSGNPHPYCDSIKYLDPFDTMGEDASRVFEENDPGIWHFNAGIKSQLGWLKQSFSCGINNQVCIHPANKTDLVKIAPLELPFLSSSNPIRAVEIPLIGFGNGWSAMVEYRQPIGLDKISYAPSSIFNGASIRIKSPSDMDTGITHLVDSTPNSNSNNLIQDFYDSTLSPTDVLYISDTQELNRIETCAMDDTGLTVAINQDCPGMESSIMPITTVNFTTSGQI